MSLIKTIKCPAKINLAIDVLGKRANGYHDVRMIMQTVSLYDTVHIRAERDEIRITTDSDLIPTNQENIVYKTAAYLRTTYGVKAGAWLHIDKKIPVAAGLAGGSTNAAAALKLLNVLWDLRLTHNELMDAGLQIGADVPYCIQGGTALAEGLGEKLTPITPMPQCPILLVKPAVSISTKEVYEGLKLETIDKRPDINSMLKAIEEGNLQNIAKLLENVLETVTLKKCPEIQQIKKRLLECGAIGSIMSGSGPTVFGLFNDIETASCAYERMKETTRDVFLVQTVAQGGL